MVTSNASEEVWCQFAMNTATYSNVPIGWIIHHFWNSIQLAGRGCRQDVL